MQRLRAAVIRVETDLQASGVGWALIGGLAVSARSEPRTTRDVDVAIAVPSDSEAEAIVRSFFDRGYRFEDQLEQKAALRLATMRLRLPGAADRGGGVVVDLLFASSGIEDEVVAAAEILEVMDGVFVPVAQTGHLLALKVLAYDPRHPEKRPQDLGDIRQLLGVATAEELERAERGLDLISRRGFARGGDEGLRNLRAEFEGYVRKFGVGGADGP